MNENVLGVLGIIVWVLLFVKYWNQIADLIVDWANQLGERMAPGKPAEYLLDANDWTIPKEIDETYRMLGKVAAEHEMELNDAVAGIFDLPALPNNHEVEILPLAQEQMQGRFVTCEYCKNENWMVPNSGEKDCNICGGQLIWIPQVVIMADRNLSMRDREVTTKAVKVFLEDPETILILQPGVRVFVDGLPLVPTDEPPMLSVRTENANFHQWDFPRIEGPTIDEIDQIAIGEIISKQLNLCVEKVTKRPMPSDSGGTIAR